MFKFMAGLMFALWAGVCWADDKPQIGPAPGWAKPIDAPIPPASADMSAPVRRLLTDVQVKFDERGDERYTHTAFKMQTPAGLTAGNVVLAWNPDTDRLTIHQVRIIRGAEVIDLLARGQKFTVLRRETNLERAMLDGVLTASLQPEGLQVGDILDVAYTVHHSDPVMKGNSESLLALLAGPPTDHLRIREFWRADRPALWKQTGGFKEPTIVTTANVTELVADEHQVAKPIPPKGAPARYLMGGMLETSQFHDWSDVSALMAPLYIKAAGLSANSPLQAELAKIRRASSDPKVRAAAALHLVQDKVRYLFLGMNAGGYVPADADVTWSRRFGDCKGKTALLLALLRGLDIDAEPAMVSTAGGDGLDGRLPMVEWFDHILVRAQIGGHTYWLDGTRAGDRSLDEVRVPAFGWALPVQPTGAKLERLVEPPYDTPIIETRVQMDASGGLGALAPAHLEIIYRGDLGSLMHVGLAAVPPAEMQDKLKEVWSGQYRWIEIKSVDAAYDPQTGEQRLTMDGEASMAWNTDTDSGEHKYETDGSALTLGLDFKRDPGPGDDAPFALDYPLYARSTETIILPQGGKGFSVSGDDVDKTVAAHAFKRTTRLDKGVLHMEASIQALAKEMPAADAPAAKIGLRDVSGATVYLIAPKTYLRIPS
jgi:hypothetical protein